MENVDPKELEKLVIEPFANPFRVHPLVLDCQQFKKLFKSGCDCYIMNTHAFGLPEHLIDIPKELSLAIVTELSRGNIQWRDWKMFLGLQIPKTAMTCSARLMTENTNRPKDLSYLSYLRDRMQDRITFLSNKRDLEYDMENTFIDPLVQARTVIDRILNPI